MLELHLIVDVTAEDIAQGMRGICSGCPIALAVRRSAGSSLADWCGIDGDDAHVDLANGRRVEGRLPDRARIFVSDFDGNRQVWPFRFPIALKEVS